MGFATPETPPMHLKLPHNFSLKEGKNLLQQLFVKPSDYVIEFGANSELAYDLAKSIGPDGKLLIIDPNETLLENIKSKCRNQHNIEYMSCNFSDLSADLGTFDTFISNFQLLPTDSKKNIIIKIASLLRSEGRFAANILSRARIYRSLSSQNQDCELLEISNSGPRDWVHLLESCGFSKITIKQFNHYEQFTDNRIDLDFYQITASRSLH